MSETEINLFSEGSEFEGTLRLEKTTRLHGVVQGRIDGKSDSVLILAESAWIKGEIEADDVIIHGFVEGQIKGRRRIHLSSTGRVVGSLHAPSIEIDFGAQLEGRCIMPPRQAEPTAPSDGALTSPVAVG